ncbi:hypothetical protein ACFYYY_21030 [Streptomyces sp. NPDC001834]
MRALPVPGALDQFVDSTEALGRPEPARAVLAAARGCTGGEPENEDRG